MARRADKLAIVYDLPSARKDMPRIAPDLPALEQVVVGGHGLCGGLNRVVGKGIPQQNVRVFAGFYLALGGHAEDPGRLGGGERDEALRRDPARVDAVMPKDLETILDARPAVRDPGKVPAA